MSPRKVWVFDPDSGGIKIPDSVKNDIERLRKIPTHLCRLRYFGNDQWGFAFYTYSSEKYELSVFPNGEFLGKPEDAFMASAVYLNG